MQNPFVKFLVLGSVIGSSCLVVWKAHDGLKSVADKVNPSEFVALDDRQSSAAAAEGAKPDAGTGGDSWGGPLKLTGTEQEPVPTLAKAPAQTSEPAVAAGIPSEPQISPAPVQSEQREGADGALPLFFQDQAKSSTTAKAPEMPLLPTAEKAAPKKEEDSDPFAAAPAQSEAASELAQSTASAPQEFVELPGQQLEALPATTPVAPELPKSEPLPTPVAGLPQAQSQSASAREMPGLTKLSGPLDAPVLLPVDTGRPLAIPERKDTQVMNAGGITSEPADIQKISGSQSLPAPAQEVEKALAAKSPAQLPQLEDMLNQSKKRNPTTTPAPAVEVAEADPFGGSKRVAAAPVQAKEVPVEPLPTIRSAPGLFPDDSQMPAGGAVRPDRELPSPSRPSRDVPPAGNAPVLPDTAAPAMPPLPPQGEVLPEPVSAPAMPLGGAAAGSTVPPQGLELPAPAGKPTAAPTQEVLPFPASSPQTTPAKDLPDLPTGSAPDPFGAPASPQPTAMPREKEVLPDLQPALPPVEPLGSKTPAPAPTPAQTSAPTPAPVPAQTPTPVMPAVTPAPVASPNLLIGTGDLDANAPQGPQSPELKIEKVAPREAEVGEPVVYAILIRNVGGSPAKDVVVEDQIPRGTQLEGTIPQAYLNSGKLSWQLGTIEPGAERKIQLKVVPTEAGQIGSVATVSFAAAVSASIKVNSPKLSIAMSGPQEAAIGEPMDFHFKLKNSGQSAAKSVFLRAVLPVGLTHPGGNDLEYESGLIGPGEERDIHLVVQAEKEGHYVINAQVTNDGKSHDEAHSAINVIKSRLEITRTGTEKRFVGRAAPFVLRVTNTSMEELRGVMLQETVPPAVEVSSVPAEAVWDPKLRLLTWRLEQLRAGEFRDLNVTYTPRTAGDHRGVLVAMDGAGNKSTLETVLNAKGFSELTPHYQIDQRTVMVNERVTLQVTLENAGTASSRNVRAEFILPEGVEFISAQGPGEHRASGHQVVFAPLGEFAPGSKETFHLAVVPHQEGTAKITFKLQADDYSDPVFQDQAIRVVPAGQ